MFIQESLKRYAPQWIENGIGISLICPRHYRLNHRVEFYFDNPLDGGEPRNHGDGVLVHRLGDDFDDLTLTSVHPNTPEDPLFIPGHWRGWLARSILIHSLRGVEW